MKTGLRRRRAERQGLVLRLYRKARCGGHDHARLHYGGFGGFFFFLVHHFIIIIAVLLFVSPRDSTGFPQTETGGPGMERGLEAGGVLRLHDGLRDHRPRQGSGRVVRREDGRPARGDRRRPSRQGGRPRREDPAWAARGGQD
jgi:hypothetical protein